MAGHASMRRSRQFAYQRLSMVEIRARSLLALQARASSSSSPFKQWSRPVPAANFRPNGDCSKNPSVQPSSSQESQQQDRPESPLYKLFTQQSRRPGSPAPQSTPRISTLSSLVAATSANQAQQRSQTTEPAPKASSSIFDQLFPSQKSPALTTRPGNFSRPQRPRDSLYPGNPATASPTRNRPPQRPWSPSSSAKPSSAGFAPESYTNRRVPQSAAPGQERAPRVQQSVPVEEFAAPEESLDVDDCAGFDSAGHKPSRGSARRMTYREERVDLEQKQDRASRQLSGRNWSHDILEDEEAEIDDEDFHRPLNNNRRAQKEVILPSAINVASLAQMLELRIGRVLPYVRKLSGLGKSIGGDYILNAEMAALVAAELAPHITVIAPAAEAVDSDAHLPQRSSARRTPEAYAALPKRSPVVTIMGHVDHGKTTLLDTLRQSSVVAGEAGGITQHIGAFQVGMSSGDTITFLDTPGHAAFEAMRARGAHVTDIVVLVVAADDGVMPQTVEAIKHARAAGVSMIVAVNKCDRPGCDFDRIYRQLLQHDVHVEDLGGDIISVKISALKGTGINELEEAILTLAELQELRADPTAQVEGVTLESHVAKGQGIVATVLINEGTLRVGDSIVAGGAWCRVKSMQDDAGSSVAEAGPGVPVRMLGWRDMPAAGDPIGQVADESAAKRAIDAWNRRAQRAAATAELDAITSKRLIADAEREGVSHNDRKAKITALYEARQRDAQEAKGPIDVCVVVKGDMSGSVEAVVDAVSAIRHPELRVRVVSSGVGPVTESDVERAYAAKDTGANGIVIGFTVRADRKAAALAKRHDVQVLSSRVIYHLINDLKAHMAGLLPPEIREEVVGEATVSQVFEISVGRGVERIAGCKVSMGELRRQGLVRVVRAGKTLWDGRLRTIKHFKREVQEIAKGNECGLAFEEFEDFQESDVVQAIKLVEIPRALT